VQILTFAGVERSPYLWRPVATTLTEALKIPRDAVKEMDSRYQTLAREGFVNLGERIKRNVEGVIRDGRRTGGRAYGYLPVCETCGRG
jgi:DNA segregation ATPase FtsK/SpoIIIE-like protein